MLTLILSRFKKNLLTFSCIVLALPVYAGQDEVKIAFNTALTPYAIEKAENGIEVEIVRQALGKVGYKLAPVFGSPEFKVELFDQNKVDGIATVSESTDINATYSNIYVTFQDVVITLKSRDLSIKDLRDLKGLKISAYQGAAQRLGKPFQEITKNNPLYSEEAQQLNQNQLLFDGEVDIIIVDRTIFNHLNQMLGNKALPVIVQPLVLDKVPYRIGFHQAALRDKFNTGLKKLSVEDIQAIYAQYQEAIRLRP